ncbi:GntR family transcriptional regulator [Photobacterium sp. GJ3]|uniref:GntR family transcriptional regulator n=1 Tax=Photobacterium sp. GJ3 TaxID=2829502 RepID=UPI001B8BE71E|nr:GntR family transcriptional regulator [Photobacterium sp. GJ3]QUJ67965.1 GntR family transcriptional regulator [Photobacterium sp. GJ3]
MGVRIAIPTFSFETSAGLMFNFILNKNLPIGAQAQLEGYIEFGIMSGYFWHQPQLPSVRELAAQLDISQATVSKAYENLKKKSLIYTLPGKGVFVHQPTLESERQQSIESLKGDFRSLIQRSRSLNIDPILFIHLFDEGVKPIKLDKKVAWVGNATRVNEKYIRELEKLVDIQPKIDNFSFDEFSSYSNKSDYGLILTIPHCVSKVEGMLSGTPILAPYLVPSPVVIQHLKEMKRNSKILMVSAYQNFIPVMMEGVNVYLNEDYEITSIFVDDLVSEMNRQTYDVIIYSSGCFDTIKKINLSESIVFEYDHIPAYEYLQGIAIPALYKMTCEHRAEKEK